MKLLRLSRAAGMHLLKTPKVNSKVVQPIPLFSGHLFDAQHRAMSINTRPTVCLSYRWIDIEHQGRPARAPNPQGLELAEKLRARGFDVRFDMYFHRSRHGFSPPQRVAGGPRNPWLVWATQQVAEAGVVLMLCTPNYAQADGGGGSSWGEWGPWVQLGEAERIATRVPSLWWDWLAIMRECDMEPEKLMPVGPGFYHGDLSPAFVRGSNYQDLESPGATDALLRRIRNVWRARVPRRGVELRTDRDIEPGGPWHESIPAALDRARVAVLMVSPDFLASSYTRSNELPKMLDASAADGLTIFWIPVRPSSYKQSPIARFQSAHPPDQPLSKWSGAGRDEAFVKIAEKRAKGLGVWIRASNLSGLELTLGEMARAVRGAERSVTYADRSSDAFLPAAHSPARQGDRESPSVSTLGWHTLAGTSPVRDGRGSRCLAAGSFVPDGTLPYCPNGSHR